MDYIKREASMISTMGPSVPGNADFTHLPLVEV